MFVEISAVPFDYVNKRRQMPLLIGSRKKLFNPSSPHLCENVNFTDESNIQLTGTAKEEVAAAATTESIEFNFIPHIEQANEAGKTTVSSEDATVPMGTIQTRQINKKMTDCEKYAPFDFSFFIAAEKQYVTSKPYDKETEFKTEHPEQKLTNSNKKEQAEKEDEYYKMILKALQNGQVVTDETLIDRVVTAETVKYQEVTDNPYGETDEDRERTEMEQNSEENHSTTRQMDVKDNVAFDFDQTEEDTSETEFHGDNFQSLKKVENQHEETNQVEDVSSPVLDLQEEETTEGISYMDTTHANSVNEIYRRVNINNNHVSPNDRRLKEYVVDMGKSSRLTDDLEFGEYHIQDNAIRSNTNNRYNYKNIWERVNYIDYQQEEPRGEYDQEPVGYLMADSGQHNKYKRKSVFSIQDILTYLSSSEVPRKDFTKDDDISGLRLLHTSTALPEQTTRNNLEIKLTLSDDSDYQEHAATDQPVSEDQNKHQEISAPGSVQENISRNGKNSDDINSGIRLLRLLKLFRLSG